MDQVTLLQRIWGPLERGESHDYSQFFDSLHDDVVLVTSAGELHGKAAVSRYFAITSQTIDAQPFVSPLGYFSDGERAIIVGKETFRLRSNGQTTSSDWAWVHDFRADKVSRIVAIQDLGVVRPVISEAISAANAA